MRKLILGFALTFCISVSAFAAKLAVDGLVVTVEAERMLVAHRPVPGYMPAMVMPFDLNGRHPQLKPGMRVQFEIDRGRTQARNITVVGEDFEFPRPSPIGIGAALPSVTLVDHRNRSLRTTDLAGHISAINFIYTRCPLPNVCPRQSAVFAALQKRFGSTVRLLSVTLDPEYDTPERLAEYARTWRADDSRWRLATGDPAEVRKLATSLGVIYWPEEGVLAHSSATAIINREGRLAALVEGASHRLDQIASLIEAQLEAK